MALSSGRMARLLFVMGVLLCAVGKSSSRPSSDLTSTNDASSHGFLIAASLTAIATICLVVALAVCSCCDGYEQFPGLSTNRPQTSAQTTTNLFAPVSTTESENVAVTIEPLPEVTNLRPAKVTSPPPKVTPPPATNNLVNREQSREQNVARKEWETFDERANEHQQMQPMATAQISSNMHDIVDDQGLPYSPIAQMKGPLLQHQMKQLNSTSTPDDETKQPVITQQRKSSKAPPPLLLDDDVPIAPIATPALREAYDRNRSAVLQLSDEDIRAIPPSEREERVYQFLTPEEIWSLEGRVAAMVSPVKAKRSVVAPLDVSESQAMSDEPAVALSTLSDEHESKRKELLDLPDGQLAQMPLAEIESYFPHLTAVEILGVQERVKRLQSIQDRSLLSDINNSSRRHSALSDASRSYLRSLHSTLSVRGDETGFYIEDDIIGDESQQQSAMDVREMLLNANADSLIEIDSDLLTKAFVYLTPEEFADTQQHLMLAKESKRAELLAASGAELRSLPAARLEAWMALLEPSEAEAVRGRMAEEDDSVERACIERASVLDTSNSTAASDALKVDYDVKANWRLTPNMSLSSSPDPTTQHFDFSSTEPPIVQVSQSEPLVSPIEEEHEAKAVSREDSLTEEVARSSETTPTEQSLIEDLVQLDTTPGDGVFEPPPPPHVSSQPSALNHISGLDDLELFLSEEAPGDHSVTDVSYESALSDLMPVDTFGTPSVHKADDTEAVTPTPVEEVVVGELIDQVLNSVGAELQTATHRPHSPESSL